MKVSKNHLVISMTALFSLYSFNVYSDCPEDPQSIFLPISSIVPTEGQEISYRDDTMNNGLVRNSHNRASAFRDIYDGGSVTRNASDLSLIDQELIQKPKGDSGSYQMGCMEEVLVTGVRITTQGFLFYFFSALNNSYYNSNGEGGGSGTVTPDSDDVGDETVESPDDPNAPYATCASGDLEKFLHALADYKKLPFGLKSGFTAGGPLRIRYTDGDTELWWVATPFSSNPFGGSAPMPGTCREG